MPVFEGVLVVLAVVIGIMIVAVTALTIWEAWGDVPPHDED